MASITRWKGSRWRARYRTPEGQSRSKVFDRKVDAERWLTSVEHSKLVGAYVDPAAGKVTVAEFWTAWSARQPWRASSRTVIESYFNRHVLPALGARPLNTLRRGDIEAWTARLPVSPVTAKQIAGHLTGMLAAAVADGLIAQNPAQGAKRPSIERGLVVPFTAEEVDALRSASPAWFAVALDLGLGAGLRQAEATGLTADRVDLLRRTLTIDRQLVTPKAGPCTFGPPKTARSTRKVPLADSVVRALAAHLEEFGVGQHGLVLHAQGEPLRRPRFGDIWRQVRGAAGLPAARFHDTRHTFASTLLAGGVSVAATADYLGHSPAVLLTTYAHLMPADHDRARSVVEQAFARDAACHARVTGRGTENVASL